LPLGPITGSDRLRIDHIETGDRSGTLLSFKEVQRTAACSGSGRSMPVAGLTLTDGHWSSPSSTTAFQTRNAIQVVSCSI